MRLNIRKNKEAFARGRNPKTGTNNALWKEIVDIDDKKFTVEAGPFNNKFGRQDLLIKLEVYGQDKEEG